MNRRLLLISNSTNYGEKYLAWCVQYIKEFLDINGSKQVLFIPYAGVNLAGGDIAISFSEYEKKVANVFKGIGYEIRSVHRETDPVAAVRNSGTIVVGGGNTFHLVYMMHKTGIMEVLREKVLQGTPFAGWSAGANVACPSLRTTNDMPITEPLNFNCLNLVPFQINPHYLDANPEGHGGETRQQRLEEFLAVNHDIKVAGLRESSFLHIEDDRMILGGARPLRLFEFGKEPAEYAPGSNLSFLLY